MENSRSNRILVTPSATAKDQYLYVQEVGTLESLQPHISRRQNLTSYLFFIVLQGSGTLTYKNQVHALLKGACVYIDCHFDYSHESSSLDPWQLMWVHFDGKMASFYHNQFTEHANTCVFYPSHVNLFLDCLNHIYTLHENFHLFTELHSHLALTQLSTYCITELGAGNNPDSSIDSKLQTIHDYMSLHFASNITLDLLSKEFYISKFYLAREFKRKYGVTIITALLTLRLSHAKSLLRFGDDSIQSISSQCGFQDVGYFIKVFKRAEGLTPHVYRKKW